jgi:type I restriction enzyme, R subunit
MTTPGTQSEAQLEEQLIQRLMGLGYERVSITNADELRSNLKRQIEVHNKLDLSQGEFNKVLNHLDKGNVFQRAKTLRDRYQLTRDDGSSCYIQFMNTVHWCQNQYQVTHQITQDGKYENRYDVTLLVNGLPLVQIELKRRGIELKEAFNQINRYQRHSFWAENGLFNYVQLFVISNGVNTKYYANNRKQEFKQTFFWTDEENNKITKLDDFTDVFLEKCHVSKIISQYIVLHESDKLLMVLRPYQYYAVEAIVDRVMEGRKHGYIWHTTGSGKTLTSFKAAQILTELPKVHKVVFVVDRADLDYQTTREFNYFSEGSVDGTDNTASLVKQMAGDNPLIVTTIQKLNTAIKKTKHEVAMDALRDKRVVFIFDECHRSQFGDTHKNIVSFFTRAQMFGFTGTPIFEENATANQHGKRTTAMLFGGETALHKYVITNAIADDNVLKFAIEYWGKLKRKDGSLIDENVPAINKKEFFEGDERLNGIADWVIANHGRKTHNKQFSAMMCVSNVETLIKYYEIFQAKKAAGEHDLRIITCFTYGTNEDDADANGLIGEPDFDINSDEPETKHTREKLDSFVSDYNAMYQTSHSVKDSKAFYAYYKDIAKRMKERDKESFQDKDRADILLVVNMFLTGFDAKKLNTLYVDKNLKFHGLIQAYSRTNRILGELKSQGNIVAFRNLKDATDEAIKLFCDTDANEKILMEPYEDYVEKFNECLGSVFGMAATPDAVNDLISEDQQALFVKAFRELIRTLNKLKPFSDFTWEDLNLSEQEFEDFKSKYLDIYDRSHNGQTEAVSILEELDFELELIHRDEINVAYILKLLGDIQKKRKKEGDTEESRKAIKNVLDMLGNETQLRSKRELIERFMQEYMPNIPEEQDLGGMFAGFWNKEKRDAIHALCERENMDKDKVYKLLDEYNFSGKDPLREDVFKTLEYKPKLMERKKLYTRILADLKSIIHRYDDDTGYLPSFSISEFDEQKTIQEVAHRIGDSQIIFTDEVKHNKDVEELVRFSICLDEPYKQAVSDLSSYPIAGELVGRGVVSDSILTSYMTLISDFSMTLNEFDITFEPIDKIGEGGVFWSLTEAREGSTIIDLALNAFGYTVTIGGPIMAFLMAYPKAADGLDRLMKDVNKRFNRVESRESAIISKDLDLEFEKARLDRAHKK